MVVLAGEGGARRGEVPDAGTPTWSALLVRRTVQIAVVLATMWLVAAIYLVNIEFDDGYATIINSKYLLGSAPTYYWQRGPVLAFLLTPAEYLARLWNLEPFNVRIHHALMAVLHCGYLIGTWRFLTDRYGERPSTLIAYLGAVFTVVFFSYAPFLSHDLVPGLVVVWMLSLASRYWAQPTWRTWSWLVCVGATLALIKQTYALVWVVLLLAQLVVVVVFDRNWRPSIRKLGLLSLAAAASAIITWTVYAYFLGSVIEATPLLLRPIVQIKTIAGMYTPEGSAREVFYQWLYLRNLSAYGLVAVVLIGPGLILSLRSSERSHKVAAVFWLLMVAVMQAIPFKEVRYLAFLAPLTALLIVPSAEWAWRRHAVPRILLVLALLAQLAGSGAEALRLKAPFYRNAATDFLRPLPRATELAGKFVYATSLSFVSPEKYAFFADRYHRITHISGEHIRFLLGYGPNQYLRLQTFENFDASVLPPGSVLLFVNEIALRAPPFRLDNLTLLSDAFMRSISIAERVTLRRDGEIYRIDGDVSAPFMLLPAPTIKATPVIAPGHLPVAMLTSLMGLAEAPDQLTLIAFRIRSLCFNQNCRNY